MQLFIKALCTLAAVLPLATAKPHPHAIHHRDIDYSDLEARQAGVPGSTPRCSKRGAHLVITSGKGSPNIGGYGLLSSTTNAIKAAIPYSNNMSTAYDKDNPSIPAGVVDGVGNLTAHIEWYTAGCPNTPIILLGYSQGAIVTMNTLCGRSVPASPTNAGIDQKYASSIAAIILYGDETRTPQPYNSGTCTTGSGVNPRQQVATCGVYTSDVASWCDINDPECCVTQGDDQDINIHYTYPSKYDGVATQYAVEKFMAWKAARKAGTTWPTASAGASAASSATPADTSVPAVASAPASSATSVTSALPVASVAPAPAPMGGQSYQGASPTNAAFKAWLAQAKAKVEGWLDAHGFDQ